MYISLSRNETVCLLLKATTFLPFFNRKVELVAITPLLLLLVRLALMALGDVL